MASLIPGTLLKLLKAMNSNTKDTGNHLFQIINIVPASPGGPHFCPDNEFNIQLSDSEYSSYISLSNRYNDLVLANALQLGQFVYVDQLHFLRPPLPVATGLYPIPDCHPFLGNPVQLEVLVSQNKRGFLIQFVTLPDPGNYGPHTVPPAKESVLLVENSGGGRTEKVLSEKQSFSSACGRSVSVKKSGSGSTLQVERDNSPARKSGSQPPSPVPSKCEVPSLVTAKEESRRSSRESVTIVPSRYRQPSPSRQKQESLSERSSLSPGRSLSGGLKTSPGVAAVADSASKKKMAKMAVGSAKNMRKSWEGPGVAAAHCVEQKVKGVSRNKQVFEKF